MAQTNDTRKSDMNDSILAQLIECGLHARYSTDVEGGNWARAQIREELLKRGWTLPPYTNAHDLTEAKEN